MPNVVANSVFATLQALGASGFLANLAFPAKFLLAYRALNPATVNKVGKVVYEKDAALPNVVTTGSMLAALQSLGTSGFFTPFASKKVGASLLPIAK